MPLCLPQLPFLILTGPYRLLRGAGARTLVCRGVGGEPARMDLVRGRRLRLADMVPRCSTPGASHKVHRLSRLLPAAVVIRPLSPPP